MSFEIIFGYNSFPEGTNYLKSVNVPSPTATVDPSPVYPTLYSNFSGPKNFIKTLNELLRNHFVRHIPLHFIDYTNNIPGHPVFKLLPFIVPNSVISAQAHEPLVNLKDYLTPWELFTFQCFFQYIEMLLMNGSLYKDQARHWILEHFYSHLIEDKVPYRKKLISPVKIGGKNQLIMFYTENEPTLFYNGKDLVLTGIVTVSKKDKITVFCDKEGRESKLQLYDSNDSKINSNIAELMERKDYLELIIWSCDTMKKMPNYSLKAIDFIAQMFTGIDGYYAQALFTSMKEVNEQNDKILNYLTTIALFFRRHLFILKVAVWCEMENIKAPEELFANHTVSLHFLVDMMHKTSKVVINRIVDRILLVARDYRKEELETDPYIAKIYDAFWYALLENCCSFPKTVFDICRYIFVATYKKFGAQARNPYIGVNTIFFMKLIVPTLMEKVESSDPIRKSMILVTHAISQLCSGGQLTQISVRGQKALSLFLSKITAEYSGKIDMSLPPVEKYIKAVKKLIDYTDANSTKLKQNLKNPQWKWKIIEELLFSYFINKY